MAELHPDVDVSDGGWTAEIPSSAAYVFRGTFAGGGGLDSITTSIDIGTASADRLVIVGAACGGNKTLTSVTVNGVTLNIDIQRHAGDSGVAICSALVPSGSGSQSIVATWSSGAFQDRLISVWTATGLTSNVVKHSQSASRVGGAGGTASITVDAGDFMFLIGSAFGTAPTYASSTEVADATHNAGTGYLIGGADWTVDTANFTFSIVSSNVSDLDWAAASYATAQVSSNLSGAIDEVVIDDTDLIRSAAMPLSDACVVALGDPGGTPGEPMTVTYRYRRSGVRNISLSIALLQGSTVIASWSHSGISTSYITATRILTAGEFAAISDFTDLRLQFLSTVIPFEDTATTAWAAAVVVNGGTVGAARRIAVNSLITSLEADGIWNKLDRLWLYAAENEPSALTDIVSASLATNISSTAFTVDLGYTGDGAADYINSNFNPTTAPSPKYIQDSASIFAWSNTSGNDGGALVGTSVVNSTRIFPRFTDTATYWGINASGGGEGSGAAATTGQTGLWLATRTAAAVERLDANGANVLSGTVASTTIPNSNLWCLRESTFYSTRQVCCFGCGAQLSAAESANLNTHLRTYMTAVGVP